MCDKCFLRESINAKNARKNHDNYCKIGDNVRNVKNAQNSINNAKWEIRFIAINYNAINCKNFLLFSLLLQFFAFIILCEKCDMREMRNAKMWEMLWFEKS